MREKVTRFVFEAISHTKFDFHLKFGEMPLRIHQFFCIINSFIGTYATMLSLDAVKSMIEGE